MKIGIDGSEEFQELITGRVGWIGRQPVSSTYGFQMKYDQFGNIIDENFEDPSERLLIDHFENTVLHIKQDHLKDTFSMIELGSNNCFYSMLFKKIFAPKKTLNIMVEPYEKYLNLGKEHFDINNFEGIFLNKKIDTPEGWGAKNIHFTCESTTVDDLMREFKIDELDVLHCDIDGAEFLALESAKDALSRKKINVLFILTHNTHPNKFSIHDQCFDLLLKKYGYTCILNHTISDVGGDTILVFKKSLFYCN